MKHSCSTGHRCGTKNRVQCPLMSYLWNSFTCLVDEARRCRRLGAPGSVRLLPQRVAYDDGGGANVWAQRLRAAGPWSRRGHEVKKPLCIMASGGRRIVLIPISECWCSSSMHGAIPRVSAPGVTVLHGLCWLFGCVHVHGDAAEAEMRQR